MRGIDHQLIRLVEHAQPAPADEPLVDRLVRTTLARCIPPAQPVRDHEGDPADDPTIIDPRHSMRQRTIRFDPAHLCCRQPYRPYPPSPRNTQAAGRLLPADWHDRRSTASVSG